MVFQEADSPGQDGAVYPDITRGATAARPSSPAFLPPDLPLLAQNKAGVKFLEQVVGVCFVPHDNAKDKPIESGSPRVT